MGNNFRSCKFSNSFLQVLNHASVLITDEKNQYVYDPTNITVFNFINHEKALDILYPRSILVNKYHSIITCDSSKRLETIKKFYSTSVLTSMYNVDDFVYSYKNQLNNFNSNRGIIKDFYSYITNRFIRYG